MILDGEIVAFDADGKPSFNALQNRAQLKTAREIAPPTSERRACSTASICCISPASTCAQRPYRDRRRYLAQCLLPSPLVQLVHAADDGVALYAAALASGFEGVVGKRKDSRYEPGRRSPHVAQGKPTHSGEFVIGGYTQGKGARAPLGALLRRLLGRATSCATLARGLRLRRRYARRVKARLRRCSATPLPVRGEARADTAPTTWVEPELVAEVEYQSWTTMAVCARRCSCACATTSIRKPCGGPLRACQSAGARRSEAPPQDRADRRGLAASSTPRRRTFDARGRRASHQAHQPRPRVLAGRRRARAAGAHQARPAALFRAASRRSCCRISPTGRSR